MKDNDTSADYEDMVGFISEDNMNKSSLSNFLEDQEDQEYRPSVKPKRVDSDFPEQWQKLIINFETQEDFANFMIKMGSKPISRLKSIVYERPSVRKDILNFMSDDE